MTKLHYKEIWDGEYRGVRFEVVHWRLGWNYYLYIPLDQLLFGGQKTFTRRLKTCNFLSRGRKVLEFEDSFAPILSDLDWHGGITLYEKKHDKKGNLIGFRLGCDYAHSWDKGNQYKQRGVVSDAKRSIDRLWVLIPNLKLRCCWNGQYYNSDEVFYTEHGVCVANENKEKWYEVS